MIMVAGFVIVLGVNLLFFIVLVWIINLIIMFVIFYFIYKFGVWLMGIFV